MYLSRLILNPRNRHVQRDTAYPRELHRTVMSAFPDNLTSSGEATGSEAASVAERILFRLEQHPQSGLLSLLVQSQLAPDWTPLQEDSYLLPQHALPSTMSKNPAVKTVNLHVAPGQRLSFRLSANPTKRLSAGTGNKGKRVGLYKVEEQIEWLQRKAAQSGFAVLSAMPTQQQRTDDRRHSLKFFSVQFDGVLQVTAPESFLHAIQQGIGSGKAFGFGLLSVAPVR